MTNVRRRGPKLLFLTGSNGDLRNENTPLNSPLTDAFTVLSYDQRGLGQSSKPDVLYSMRNYADYAIAILDQLGWDRAHLVGYSFGGMVAQELAIGWPERLNRLVFAATTAGGAGGSSYPIHELIHMEPRGRARAGLEVSDLSFTPEWQSMNQNEYSRR